ncbi:MAG: hypothetical protein JO227_07380 [Acetobacteraceae bacterium]|nr:hypothetical protein [Acetobacteraceae bacterium]
MNAQQDLLHLRSRAHELLVAAATTSDPHIAQALRDVAAEFELEAREEERELQSKAGPLSGN